MAGFASPCLVLVLWIMRENLPMLAIDIGTVLLLMAGLTLIRTYIFSRGLLCLDGANCHHHDDKQAKSIPVAFHDHFPIPDCLAIP